MVMEDAELPSRVPKSTKSLLKLMSILTGESLFESGLLSNDLVRKSVRGGLTTMTAQGAQFVLRIVSTVILARLLMPTDYGLIGMVAVVVNFAGIFKDAGLSTATVQADSITHEQISALFWINLIISAALSSCVFVSAPFVSRFYGKWELFYVTMTLSVSFLITGLTIQHQALLRRHMRFDLLAIVQIGSQVVAVVVTIFMAYFGWRYWALVGGTLAQAASATLLTFFYCPWIPGRIKRGTGVRGMLKFGWHISGFNFVNYFSRNADNILIGKFMGADTLGLYSKAYQLFSMPVSQIRQPINDVAIPALSAIRHNHKKYRAYYREVIFLVAVLSMPLVSFMVVFSPNIILLMLGKNWYGAEGIFRALALAAFVQAVTTAGRGLPMLSMGFSRRYFHFGILQSLVTCLGIIIGLHWGAVGVAAGYGISFCLLIPFTLSWCLRGSPVTPRDFFSAAWRPFVASAIQFLCLFWLQRSLLSGTDVINLSSFQNAGCILLGVAVSAIVFFVSIMSFPVGRKYLFLLYRQFKSAFARAKINAASQPNP